MTSNHRTGPESPSVIRRRYDTASLVLLWWCLLQ